MQSDANLRMLLKQLHKGQIGMRVSLLNNAIEVSDRLVSVNQQYKLEFRHKASWNYATRIP
jgi:hypothetical protein